MQIKFINRQTKELITENPPAQGLMRFLYGNPLGKWLFLPLVVRKFVSVWYGKKMSHTSSTKKISSFVQTLGIDMQESQKKENEFSSFNDFFYRQLKPQARPIGTGVVSPGDGRLLAFQNLSEVKQFFVKGHDFTLKEYLKNEKLAEHYAQGAMIILRLAPNDYHRYHFPYSGLATETEVISGKYFSISPIALAHNFSRVFLENKRAVCELQTADKGIILISPVAATMVGSMIHTYKAGKVEKGQEMGYFAFGGSTLVLLFEPNKIIIDQDLITNTQNGLETYVKMGEKIAE